MNNNQEFTSETQDYLKKEQERDMLLHDAQIICLRNKINCKTEKPNKLYGMTNIAIHRDRNYLLSNINQETKTGTCSCGKTINILAEPFYCAYCGQRLSALYGWTASNYYNE